MLTIGLIIFLRIKHIVAIILGHSYSLLHASTLSAHWLLSSLRSQSRSPNAQPAPPGASQDPPVLLRLPGSCPRKATNSQTPLRKRALPLRPRSAPSLRCLCRSKPWRQGHPEDKLALSRRAQKTHAALLLPAQTSCSTFAPSSRAPGLLRSALGLAPSGRPPPPYEAQRLLIHVTVERF
jgi:hypothetical protein